MIALGGAPEALNNPTVREGRDAGPSIAGQRSRPGGFDRRPDPNRSSTPTAAAAPTRSNLTSKSKPGFGSANRASPTGMNTDSAAASATPPHAPESATTKLRIMVNLNS